MDELVGAIGPQAAAPTSNTPRLVRRGARALVLDDAGRLLLIRRDKPGRTEYRTTPGGGIEVGETDEAAFHRELFEETGATATLIHQVFLWSAPRNAGVAVQHFYRLLTLDVTLRNGPEFNDPSRGSYDLEFVGLGDADALFALPLWPEGLAEFVTQHSAALLLEAGLTP
jgi:ADP-ribose pyrophosphatase YjhB (NUDIX family)